MNSRPALLVLLSLSTLFLVADAVSAEENVKIRFKKIQLDEKFRSEGVAVGDFNNDGKQDVAAGCVWYEAPDWKMHTIANEPASGSGSMLGTPPHFKPQGYSNSFSNYADDVNGDGWMDLIVVDFPSRPTWWYENPKVEGKEWIKHLGTPVTNNESPAYADVDGDGTKDLVAAFAPSTAVANGPDRQMGYFTRGDDPNAPWKIHPVSVKAAPGCRMYYHGLGVGDVNSDGRADILCSDGWWEAPADRDAALWKFHRVGFGQAGKTANDEHLSAHLHVEDFDGDGDADVLASSPHSYGIWWHEQVGANLWKKHEIDRSYSQTHGVCVADINGDGLTDFVTGKRWWAHGGGDPGGDEPAVFCWYELSREGGKVKWIRHQFDHDSGPGTQFQVADVNRDGLIDIVTSNKKGVYVFLQERE